jgi:(p)ppGpp synthase/HD superfamily hydrolase
LTLRQTGTEKDAAAQSAGQGSSLNDERHQARSVGLKWKSSRKPRRSPPKSTPISAAIIAAAYLHDTVEDTETTMQEVIARFTAVWE